MPENEDILNTNIIDSKKLDGAISSINDTIHKLEELVPLEIETPDRTAALIDIGDPIIQDASPVVKANKKFAPVHADSIEKIFGQLINSNSNGIFVEPTCPICTAKYRHSMEALYHKQDPKSYLELQKFLKDKENLEVSIPVIENHIFNHSMKGVQELQKVEYVAKLRRLNSVGLTTLDKIQLSTEMIYERLIETSSLSPNQYVSAHEINQMKNSDVMKLTKQLVELLKLQADIMGEMKSSGAMLSIESNSFVEAFNETMKNARTDGERKLVKSLIDLIAKANKG